jgi:DNA-binding Xre family transcriptional regulator
MNEIPKGQLIVAPSGERMVVLPEADYAALVQRLEDAEDIASARVVLARIDAGEEELVPSEVVERLIAGENPIQVWREYRGIAVPDLAEAAGLPASALSEIEAGIREGRAGELLRMAAALSVDLDDLMVEPMP